VPIGLFSGYSGGLSDLLAQRIVDSMLSFPMLIMGLMVAAIIGAGYIPLVLAVGVALSPRFARLTRASTLKVKEEEYIEAAMSIGGGKLYIAYKHILRNIINPIVVQSALWVGLAILCETGLSFLGMGIQPPTPTLGNMIRWGMDSLRINPWVSVIPGLFITLIVITLNVFAEGLQNQINPRKSVQM
jgi:peptide/nickel transport system permease protein